MLRLTIGLYNTIGIWLIPAFSEPQPHWPRDPPSPLLGQSEGEARAAGGSHRGYPPVPPHRFSRFSDYHLIILINRVDAELPDYRKAQQTHRTSSAFGCKERKQHRTQRTHQHDIRFQFDDKTPPTYRMAHPPTDQAIHPPTNEFYHATAVQPPTKLYTHQPTSIQQQTDALFRAPISPEQAGYIAERTNTVVVLNKKHSSTSYRHERTHPRTKRPPPTYPTNHPPTQPTTRQPTNPSYHQKIQPIGATAEQQYLPADTDTSTQGRLVRPRNCLENTITIMGTLYLQRSTITCKFKPPMTTHPPIHNPPTNRYPYLLLHAEDTRTCDYNTHEHKSTLGEVLCGRGL